MPAILQQSFYLQKSAIIIAKDLIGKSIFTKTNGQLTGGIITETEAYDGVNDKACHAFGGRRTHRNETMYAQGGVIYVYLCYGIHHLLNIVTNEKGVPDAVLIRAIEPTHGIDIMMKRRGHKKMDKTLTSGPGSAAVALGITKDWDGTSLQSNKIWIEERGASTSSATDIYSIKNIVTTTRIGVESAGEAAKYPYRFYLDSSPFVSRR